MPSDRLMICRKSCGVVTLRIAASRRGAACSVRTSMATTGPYHRGSLLPRDLHEALDRIHRDPPRTRTATRCALDEPSGVLIALDRELASRQVIRWSFEANWARASP